MMLVLGFANGSVEVRKHRTGELLQKVQIGQNAIAQLFYYDFRLEGMPQLLALDTEGTVKGFTITRNVKQF